MDRELWKHHKEAFGPTAWKPGRQNTCLSNRSFKAVNWGNGVIPPTMFANALALTVGSFPLLVCIQDHRAWLRDTAENVVEVKLLKIQL